jgi:hypothetical protein
MARTGLEEITPELVQMAAEYFGINEDAALQKLQYAQAQKARETAMPAGLTVRDQYIAPSVLGVASSTIERIRGGQDEQKALAQLQAGILRKKDINTSALMADLARRQAEAAPPDPMMSPHPMTDEERAFVGSTPVEYGVGKTDFIPEGELSHENAPVRAAPKKPVVPPLGPPENSSPNPNQYAPLRSPFRGYKQGGVWPLPGK